MSPLLSNYPVVRCEICDKLVPEVNLPEHILADVRILQIIEATHPEWCLHECEDYFRALCGTRQRPESGETGLRTV